METNYPSNSNKLDKREPKNSPEEKKVEKAIAGTVTVKKKGAAKKFTDIFISEDAHNVGNYVLTDVIVPFTKKLISESVTTALDILLYGDKGRGRGSSIASRYGYRDYGKAYDRDRRDAVPARNKSGYNYDDIYLESRGEAEEVLTRMDELIDQYGMVSVGDLYDLVGVTGQYTDNNYGWTDLRTASVVRTRDGYMIKLPRALALPK